MVAALVFYLRGSGTVITNPGPSGWVVPVHVRFELSSPSIPLHVLDLVLDLECCWRWPETVVSGVDLHDEVMWLVKWAFVSIDVDGVSEVVACRTCGDKRCRSTSRHTEIVRDRTSATPAPGRMRAGEVMCVARRPMPLEGGASGAVSDP